MVLGQPLEHGLEMGFDAASARQRGEHAPHEDRTMTANAASTIRLVPPSIEVSLALEVAASSAVPDAATAVGWFVATDGPVDDRLGVDRAQLDLNGYTGAVGTSMLVTSIDGVARAAIGSGQGDLDAGGARDAASAFGRSVGKHVDLAVVAPATVSVDIATFAQSVVEGIVLSRYTFDALRSGPKGTPVRSITLIVDDADVTAAQRGAERGRAFAAATKLSRDLANSPHSHLSASMLAELAAQVGPSRGLEVEIFGEDELRAMGCGGILGVNAGSVEPPRMIKMTYRPDGDPTGRLGIVGKTLMYDSGGLSLKPGDEVHAQMKNDMTGGASAFAAMCVLGAVGCRAEVTAWLMCTDNMPSGTAMALGDVLTIRGGTTVEVINTDAEGRLIMADGLVLAVEAGVDAIVDIATLTGAAMRALGTSLAAVMGTDPALVEQVRTAGESTGERVWELPLEPEYRKDIDSPIADLRNLGTTPNGGAIHAGLFLAEFVDDVAWAHIDIAGVAQTPADRLWHTTGCSGFGARLLVQLAVDFEPVR
jgi:leucyl aminopeptidase